LLSDVAPEQMRKDWHARAHLPRALITGRAGAPACRLKRAATGAVALQLQIELLAISLGSYRFTGGQRELVAQTLGQPLRTLRSEPFEMIVHVGIDGTNIRKLSLDL